MAAERVTLVGASIAKGWGFDRLGDRVRLPGHRFSYAGVYAFDKGPVITRILDGGEARPTILMVKECAAYFPGDMATYQRSIAAWMDQIRRAGVEPVLVTTAPVAESPRIFGRIKHLVKRALGMPTMIEGITEFNDWLREYARREGIRIFDLEAVLRLSAGERWLRPEYDSGDRLHLNAAAYAAMDAALADFLRGRERMFAP